MHVNFDTNSKLYPYDTQKPSIKLQSLDYGEDTIHMTVKEGSRLWQTPLQSSLTRLSTKRTEKRI